MDVERLLVAVMSGDSTVPVDTSEGLLVAVMSGDSTEEADMNMAAAGMLGGSTAVGMNMAAAGMLDMGVPVAVDVAYPVVPVDMNVLVDMPGTLDIVMPVAPLPVAPLPVVPTVVVDIDNRFGSGGFGMPASMLNNLLWHYHYTVTLVFRWRGVPVEYPHKLFPQ